MLPKVVIGAVTVIVARLTNGGTRIPGCVFGYGATTPIVLRVKGDTPGGGIGAAGSGTGSVLPAALAAVEGAGEVLRFQLPRVAVGALFR